METSYTAYTKVLDNKTYYFVKKFIVFPETNSIPPILEAYGMHVDFDKACAIALLTDTKIKQQLLEEIENSVQHAKVIDLNNELISKKKAQ